MILAQVVAPVNIEICRHARRLLRRVQESAKLEILETPWIIVVPGIGCLGHSLKCRPEMLQTYQTEEGINMISRSETEVAVIAQFTAKENRTEDLVAALHQAIELGLNEPGCRRLILYQCVENPRVCTVIEKFADRKAFEAHLAATYTVNLLNEIIPELTEAQSITTHKEVLVTAARLR